MSIVTIIAIVLVLIAVISYFKQLDPKQRALQAGIVRDVTAISVVATSAFAKELGEVAIKSGRLAAKTVESEHADTIKEARQFVDNLIVNNGGTIKQTGVTLCKKTADAVYLTDANQALSKALKDLEAKGF